MPILEVVFHVLWVGGGVSPRDDPAFIFIWGGGGVYTCMYGSPHVQLSKNSVPNGGWDERMCVEKILRPLGGMFRAKSEVPTIIT